jgi:hypothetical protein
MKKRTILIVISTCLSITAILVFVIAFSIMTEGSLPTDVEIVSLSDKLIDDSMVILKKYPVDAFLINEKEWPESIKALSPLSLSANREGLYIKTKERFVES